MTNNKNAKYSLLGIAALFIIVGVATLPNMIGLGAIFLIAASGAFCAAVGIAIGDRTHKKAFNQSAEAQSAEAQSAESQPAELQSAESQPNHREGPNHLDSHPLASSNPLASKPAPVLKRASSYPSQDIPFPKVKAKAEPLRSRSPRLQRNKPPATTKVATSKTATHQVAKPRIKAKQVKPKTPVSVKQNPNQTPESKEINARGKMNHKNIINPTATKAVSKNKTILTAQPNTPKPIRKKSPTKMTVNPSAKQPVNRNSVHHGSTKVAVKEMPSATLGSYTKLFEPHPNNSEKTAFAHFYYKGSDGEYFETPFQQLAKMAVPEHWNYVHTAFHRKGLHLPILLRYINYTFMRLQQQQKIKVATVEGEPRACFNTGLQTDMGKDIFGVFSQNEKWGAGTTYSQWWFRGWVDSYSPMLQGFRPLPEVATYVADASDLMFDTSYDIDINFEHIIKDQKNRDRLPKAFQTDDILAINAIKGATAYLETKDRRNRTKAIPFWYPEKQKLQFLFPLRLTAEDHEVLALVADKQPDDRLYKIRTALTMDMAYSNARLLGKPNRDWLNP